MAVSSLASKLIGSVTRGKATMLSGTDVGKKIPIWNFDIPAMNVLWSGELDTGPSNGITVIVGDSKTFKTNTVVVAAQDFLRQYPEGVVVVFDCEFSIRTVIEQMLARNKWSDERIIYVPFTTLEELKTLAVQLINAGERTDKILYIVDSISQVASKKEAEDADDGDVKVDMTRAKEMNSFFRIITPKLVVRDNHLIAINSFYTSQKDQWADPIVKGGKQVFLSADNIFYVTRSKDRDKDTKELVGWFFKYRILKGRFVVEGQEVELHVTYDGGIDYSSSLLEWGLDSGVVVNSGHFYKFHEIAGFPAESNKSYRKKDLPKEFFEKLVKVPEFKKYIQDRYSMAHQLNGAVEEGKA